MSARFRTFRFARPTSIQEALAEHARAGDAAYLAGGTALVTGWLTGTATPPGTVISLRNVVSRSVAVTGPLVEVGAGATVADVVRRAPAAGTALGDALAAFGTPQVRERATLAGNVALAAPDSTLLPALLVLDASIEGRTRVGALGPSLAARFAGEAWPPGSLVTGVAIPVAAPSRLASAAMRLGTADELGPLVIDVAVAISFDGAGMPGRARVSVAPLADGPALMEVQADGEALRDFCRRVIADAAAAFEVGSDVVASSGYRRQLVRTVTRRALELAVRRHLSGATQAGAGNGASHRGQRAPARGADRTERDAARGPAGTTPPHGR